MCGILGYIDLSDKSKIDSEQFESALDTQRHRGPDSKGVWTNGSNLWLGMRRLSIIDVEGGTQPIRKNNDDYVLVFNGEIYNYITIREELKNIGVDFDTKSDSEVLLQAYIQWGHSFINRLDGMFAFAIYDKAKDKVLIARDRTGQKPLFVYRDESRIIFSSEIKSIKAFPDVSLVLSPESLTHYFYYGYGHPSHSVFSKIDKVSQGTYRSYSLTGKEEKAEYFSLNMGDKVKLKSEKIILETLDKHISSSIKEQVLAADVPVGALLSGGIDSSMVVAKMREVNNEVKTFTLAFDQTKYDESGQASAVAKHLNVKNIKVKYSKEDLLSSHTEVCQNFDEPFADPASFPLYVLSRRAKEEVDVVLCGDGGDELFAGYSRYSKMEKWSALARLNKLIPKWVLPPQLKKKKYLENFGEDTFATLYQKSFSIFSTKEIESLLGTDLINNHKGSFLSLMELPTNPSINDLIAYDMHTRLPESFLCKTDRVTMLNSLESRLPLLSNSLIDFSFQIDGKTKLKNKVSKYHLKKVLEKHLPSNLIYLKKKGFSVPLDAYFEGAFFDYVLDSLTDTQVRKASPLNYSYIDSLLKQLSLGNKEVVKKLWLILNFEIWYKQYTKN